MRYARTFGVCIILLSTFLSTFLSTMAMGQTIPTIEQPLVPTAAQPGGASFTLTINGAGFVPAQTGVVFGGTQLTITSSTATQLKATVPLASIASAGTAAVSAVNPGGLASNVGFFQIATPASPLFLPPVDYNPLITNQGTIESVLAADFNGDGILDLAVGVVAISSEVSDVCIMLGISGGTFQGPTCYTVDNPSSMVAGIFNNDGGSVDIAVGDQLLVNNGQGVFTIKTTPVEGFIPYAVGDFSQNGNLDIAGASGVNVQILNNNGSGSFTAGQNFTGNTTQFGGMLAADFNGDGVLDLAVLDVYQMDPVVRVFLGNTETGFSAGNPLTTSTPAGVVAFTAADFNGDSKQDLALVSSPPAGGGEVSILNGNGDGTFTSGFTTALTNPVTGAIVTSDFNEDGKLDLATGTYILQGNGDGTFQTPINLGGTAQILATGDFNGDGRPDLAAQANPNVAILIQQAPSGGAPVVSFSPMSLTFSSQTVGTMSASESIMLSNTGTAVLAIDSISITGTNSSEFAQTNSCSASLAADSSCTISVTFTPTAVGTATASVSIADNASGSPQTVSLTGTGAAATGPAVTLSPTSINFNGQPVGTGVMQQITLTNTGTATLDFESITINDETGSYSQTNTCIEMETLAVNASCTITVTFDPTFVGIISASVVINDNAIPSPQTLALTGAGAPFALTTTCTSLTVVPGQTAEYTVDLAPVGENTPTVSLACSGAPPLATCTVAQIPMPLNEMESAKVTVTTTQATSLLQPPFGNSNENRMAGLAGLAGIAGLAALVILPGKRRAKPGRRLYGLIFLLCILATVATLPSCGGAGSDPPGTAAGTYPLTVTGTYQQGSGGVITETVSFNLVVQ
jgi:HYDIN/CFA65/VesB family protein/centrosomal CEP192-like protein/VCBS repeat protein/IPT/TIG domain-containing protein